ncbi:MAG: cyclase family protein [Eubacteriaceae bacterium]
MKIKKIIDLSHEINDDMQVYPGDPKVSISDFLTHEKDGYNVSKLDFGMHTGTHINVPYHFKKNGSKITDIDINNFIGIGVLVDISYKKFHEEITILDIKDYIEDIKKSNFIIFKTGMDKYFNSNDYLSHPYLSIECASYISKLSISIVAIDVLSVDKTLSDNYPVHDILLSNNILIVENLCNLSGVKKRIGLYSFLPLKIKNGDGSPIRAVFIDDFS